jgi:hypothetical protein
MIAGSSVLVSPTATEIIFTDYLHDATYNDVTPPTMQVFIFRASDLKMYDFSSNTFTNTPGQPTATMSPMPVLPHAFYYAWNLASITNPVAGDVYSVQYGPASPGSTAVNASGIGEIRTTLPTSITTAIATAVTTAVVPAILSASLAALSDRTTLGGALAFVRKLMSNRLVETPGGPGVLTVYDDDGTTPLTTYQLRDSAGNAVTAVTGDPAQRTAAT